MNTNKEFLEKLRGLLEEIQSFFGDVIPKNFV